ncbi:MAG: hypothetical protein LKE53_07850 [Oscillospiraceae bacterium]|jgi:hypothetical protein|nr:hypothetical protein [Oscillospiraceae bacterium]
MKQKLPWLVFLLTLGVSLGLRLCQLPIETGWGPVSLVMCAVLFGGSAVCLFTARTDKTVVRLPQHSAFLGAAYLGAGLLLAGISVVFQAWNRAGDYAYLMGAGTLLAVFAGLMLFLQGCLFLSGQNFFASHPILALAPSLWCFAELFLQFRVNVASPVGLENILRTAAIIFLLLTLQSLAKMASGVKRVARGSVTSVGLPAVLTAAVAAPAAWKSASFLAGLSWALLVLALFVLISLLTLRPMSLEELSKEEEDAGEEKPQVRPVVRRKTRQTRAHRHVRPPVVASREDPHPLPQQELDARLEHSLVIYLEEHYQPQCYFYPSHKND